MSLNTNSPTDKRREETHVAASCDVSDEQLNHHLFEKKKTELKISPAVPDVDRINDVISMSFKKRNKQVRHGR